MELDNDVKSMAVTAGKTNTIERLRNHVSNRQEDMGTVKFPKGCGEAPSFKSVMDELFGKGIVSYITDYSCCRFYRPFGNDGFSSDRSVDREPSSGNDSIGVQDFIGHTYRKSNSGRKMNAAEESD